MLNNATNFKLGYLFCQLVHPRAQSRNFMRKSCKSWHHADG